MAYSDDVDSDEATALRSKGEVKKPKVKRPKKPKVAMAEAAALIDVENLEAHLVEIPGSYENKRDIQFMWFANYFGRAFASVSTSQFPWAKMFKESPVSKMVDMSEANVRRPAESAARSTAKLSLGIGVLAFFFRILGKAQNCL